MSIIQHEVSSVDRHLPYWTSSGRVNRWRQHSIIESFNTTYYSLGLAVGNRAARANYLDKREDEGE